MFIRVVFLFLLSPSYVFSGTFPAPDQTRGGVEAICPKFDYDCLYEEFKNHEYFENSNSLALHRALKFYDKHKSGEKIKCHNHAKLNLIGTDRITNHHQILITDYTILYPKPRFFILNLRSGTVARSSAAHGYGSNTAECPKEHSFWCRKWSRRQKKYVMVRRCEIPWTMGNTRNSFMTSKGFFITQEPYRSPQETFIEGDPRSNEGDNNAIRLEGLQYGINHKARDRDVVFHRAYYYKTRCSASGGCPAVSPPLFELYKDHVHSGALFYIHTIEDKDNEEIPDCA